MSPKSRARLRTWRIRLTELHRRIIWMTRNRLRARYRDLDYIVLPLQGTYPEIPPPPAIKPLPYPLNRLIPTLFPFLFPRELSLLGLEWILQAIGGDRRVAGVIFPFGTLRANRAALYSIRRMFSRIQANFEALGEYKTTPKPIPFPVPPPLAPLFNVQTGAETVIQALRNAATRTEIAAVILYVDSPGGSALASDLIWREVYRLRERKPVVALMGAQAASGGYYVAAPAHRIIARPTTLTGSIGIWGGKICLQDLYDRLAVGRGVVQRGAMAGLYSELAPFTDAERVRMRRQIAAGYTRFKERVAVGRGMDLDQVEAVARGRVWTGAQAQDIGLVDRVQNNLVRLSTSAEEIDGSLLLLWEAWRRCSSGRQWPRGDTFQNLISLPDMAGERIWALAPWVSILS